MPNKRILKISLIASLAAVCIAAVSWWAYITYTYVEFVPHAFDKQKGYVMPRTGNDFYKNLRTVLDHEHIAYTLNVLDHPVISLRLSMDKERMTELTARAQDVIWLYNHMDKKPPSFFCEGADYQGVVYRNELAYARSFAYEEITDWVPNCKDIEEVEKILRVKVEQVYKIRERYSNVHLPLYYRQYVGYRKVNGDRIVYVNLLRKDLTSVSMFLNGIARIYIGDNAFLDAKVNMTQQDVEYFGATITTR